MAGPVCLQAWVLVVGQARENRSPQFQDVGFAQLLVENVAVARSAQGRGLGRRLLEHAEDQALRLGLPETRLYTNAAMTENLAIYPRLGYAEVNRRTEDGFDRVYFRKDLRS